MYMYMRGCARASSLWTAYDGFLKNESVLPQFHAFQPLELYKEEVQFKAPH